MKALLPLAAVYGIVVAAKNELYDRGVLRPQRLRWPVVSVGNLTVGGAGKTPFVIALIEALRRHGYQCDVLSRGYGRRSKGVLMVEPAGTADEFGDEPLMIARQTGAPVFVGESRYEAGLLAERYDAQDERIHLLDDGFQHRKLSRYMDIVLLSREDVEDDLLPAGRLREGVRSLARADEIAVEERFALPLSARDKALIRYRRSLKVEHAPKPIAFCGIARPERFFRDLTHYGIGSALDLAFSDHHRYSDKDIAKLVELGEQYEAASFLTTAKDAARLTVEQRARLQPLFVAELKVDFEEPDRVVSSVLSTIAARGGHA